MRRGQADNLNIDISSGNWLFFGDNHHILRQFIPDNSIDLIYLDPPFNSKSDYNVLFSDPAGRESDAKITAFEDTWHWNVHTEQEFRTIIDSEHTAVAELIASFRTFLRESDMMAYLVMMTNRLLELHRVLKPSGSLYLHCDPTASHYLKIALDVLFGGRFRREIIWSLETTSGYKSQANNWIRSHDVILYYTKSDTFTFNKEFLPHKADYLKRFKKKDADGRPYRDDRSGGRVQYLDETPGRAVGDVWNDIMSFQQASTSAEFLGYPTQKPSLLLERIVKASSNPGDVVLDPFCGCGTAIHAAQKLGRRWIGIDITHLAISLIEKRLRDAFGKVDFQTYGVPKDIDGARDLAARDKYEFQWWACSLVNARPYGGKKKGADSGIDGLIFFQDQPGLVKKVIVSVKGGEHVQVDMIRDLKGVVEREKAEIGLFVTLAQPTKPMNEEAVKSGFYDSPNTLKYQIPRIQILTIDGLLSGTEKPQIPVDLSGGSLTLKKATKEQPEGAQDDLFR